MHTRSISSALAVLIALGAGVPALAQTRPQRLAECPSRPYRWMEDCSRLATADLNGLTRLRYLTLNDDDRLWLSLGGEARTRMEVLRDIDFHINDQPGYVSVGGRLLLHADLHTKAGPRIFAQLGIVEENGRKPGPRNQDESQVDLTQGFVDVPFKVGRVAVLARYGRQELDLTGNRLLSARDGATLRRAFEGTKVDLSYAGGKLALLSVRPMELQQDAFADFADPTESFRAASLDLPRTMVPGGGTLNLFAFDKRRQDARYLRASGRERRYTLGAHYAGQIGGWAVDAQPAFQTGRVQGLPVRAWGVAVQLDKDLGGAHRNALGVNFVAASGDNGKTRAIETFDPIYPNNGGLSDAPLFYQTNYMFGGGDYSALVGGITWTAGANLLVRSSTSDAVYAGGRTINAPFGDQRLTSFLAQVSARKTWGYRYEIYGSLVHAEALGTLSGVGGKDAFYSRLQMTARF